MGYESYTASGRALQQGKRNVCSSGLLHTHLINRCQKGKFGRTAYIIQHHKYMSTVIDSVGQTKYLG